jgi:glycogen synthase
VKIAIYSEYFFPVTGGVQSNILELACGLSEHQDSRGRIDVTLITRTGETTGEDSSWPFRLVRRPKLAKLIRLLREADVIHIAGPAMLPMAIGLALRKPVVIEHHGYQAMCPNGILLLGTDHTVCPGYFMAGRYSRCLQCNADDMGWFGSARSLVLQFPRRWLCKLASVNVSITDHVSRRIALPRTRTILYGIRDPGCTPAVVPNGHQVEIGYVGRLVPEKGVPVLLKAAKRLQDERLFFHLTIIGGGPLRTNLETEAQRLGLERSVRFAGELTGADLDRAVQPLQIVVMPSLWEETAGLSAIEQMMRGQVVVASDIGGLSEVVGDSGVKVAPGDSEALYVGLRGLLEAPSVLGSLGVAARARAAVKFKLQTMIEAYVGLYNSVLGIAIAKECKGL